MNIIIAAGGTGGHIFPGIALAEALVEADKRNRVLFIGTGKELERKIVTSSGFKIDELPSQAISGRGIKGILSLIALLPKAISSARRIYKDFSPDVVIGFGGYPSFVPLLTAGLLGVPRVLHEQNVKVGLANKVLSVIANRIFTVKGAKGFWASKAVRAVGNPVRKQFYECSDFTPPAPEQALRLFVFGGSQGAVTINNALLEMVPWLKEQSITLVHQTGSRDFERVKKKYSEIGYKPERVCAFIDDMREEYDRSHVIICRAGAMSVAEISACGRPAIYIPLVLAGSHQVENVEDLRKVGAAEIVPQTDNLANDLKDTLSSLVGEPDRLTRMASAARAFHMQGNFRPADVLARGLMDLADPKRL